MPITDYQKEFLELLDGNSSHWEMIRDIAIDASGFVYVTGGTSSTSGFPISPGLDYKTNSGSATRGSAPDTDAFLTKYTSDGQIVWSARIGGLGYDRAYAVEVDSLGNVFIGGRAGGGLKTTKGSFQTGFGGDSSPKGLYGNQDGFIAKFDAATGSLKWSTYVGGGDGGFFRDIAVDANGNVHGMLSNVSTSTSRLISANALDKTLNGQLAAVYVELSADGKSLKYGSYIDGTDKGNDGMGPAVRVGPDGDIYLMMTTDAADLYTTPGAYQSALAGGTDLYLMRLDGTTRAVKVATYFGGSDNEGLETHQLAIDAAGNFVFNTWTRSLDLEVSSTSFRTTAAGSTNAYIGRLSGDGSTLLGSTYFGSHTAGSTGSESMVVDSHSIYMVGGAGHGQLPLTVGSTSTYAGGEEGYLAVFDLNLSTLKYATYIGGSGNDGARAVQVDSQGNIYVGGSTQSSNIPLLHSADTIINGSEAALFGKYVPVTTAANTAPLIVDDTASVASGQSVTLDLLGNDTDSDGDPLQLVSVTDPSHGSVVVNSDGTITYTAATGWSGTDIFDYIAIDGNGGVGTASVAIQTIAPAPVSPKTTTVVVEFGSVTASDKGITVQLENSFVDPVVLVTMTSSNGMHVATAQIDDISSDSFTFHIAEPTYLTDGHYAESCSYLVVERGSWILSDGTVISAGIADHTGAGATGWNQVAFDPVFNAAPVVLSQIQDVAAQDWAFTRQTGAGADGFDFQIQNEERIERLNKAGPDCKVGWVAWEKGIGSGDGFDFAALSLANKYNHTWQAASFGTDLGAEVQLLGTISSYTGPDPAVLRMQGLDGTGAMLNIQEDQSFDTEVDHAPEAVDILAIAGTGYMTGVSALPEL